MAKSWRRTAIPRAGFLTAAILVLGAAAMLALNWPGQMSYDSVMQLGEGRSGLYHSWHPPVMAFLLGLFDRAVAGTGLFIAFTGGLALFSFLVMAQPRRASGFTVLLALLAMLSPQWLLYQGLVWKDVLFADAALAGFAALVLVASAQRAALWLIVAIALFTLAAMTRQNGVAILPFAAGAYGLIAAHGLSRRRAILHGVLFLIVTLGLTIGGDLLLALRGDHGADAADELRGAQAYDLTGMLARDAKLGLPRLEAEAPALAALLRSRGVALHTAERIDPFQDDPAIHAALEKTKPGLVFAQWRDSLLSHPLLYAAARGPVFWQVFATPDIIACRPLFIGVDGDPATMKQLGLTQRWRPQERFLNRYGLALTHTPFFSHLLFGALAAMLLLLLGLLRRDGRDIAVAGLLAAALTFTASFFVVSVACDYRYLYFLDLAALASVLYVCARKN